MGLIRLVMLLLVAWIVWRVYTILRARATRTPPTVEDMVRCAHCAVHLPRSQAIREGDDWFCSEAHRALGRH